MYILWDSQRLAFVPSRSIKDQYNPVICMRSVFTCGNIRLAEWNTALRYYARAGEELPTFQRMLRGTVGSLGVPLYGGLAQGARFAPAGMVGAAYGASTGALAGGVGALPGPFLFPPM
jgi:hypothetical protein